MNNDIQIVHGACKISFPVKLVIFVCPRMDLNVITYRGKHSVQGKVS